MKFALIRFFKEGSGILLINIAVVAGLGWVSALWVGQFVSARMSAIPPYSPPQVERTLQGQAGGDYSILARKNIFNPAGVYLPAVGGAITDCTLPLKLMGTIIADNKMDNAAIILNIQDKQQDLYRINNKLIQGAVITGISRFEVLINNGGRMERLSINFGDEMSGGAMEMPGSKGAHTVSGAAVSMTGEGKVLMDRRYFDSQKGNINDMMTQIRAIPNMTPSGAVDGFQLFEIAKDSIYDKVGLKNQDVLQRVNGQPLNSVETGLDLFNALKNDNHFVLDILRNKENKSITVNIQ